MKCNTNARVRACCDVERLVDLNKSNVLSRIAKQREDEIMLSFEEKIEIEIQKVNHAKLLYLREPNGNVLSRGSPIGCVASKMLVSCDDNGTKRYLVYALSVLNKNDEFSKLVARTVAMNRLHYVPLPTSGKGHVERFHHKWFAIEFPLEKEFDSHAQVIYEIMRDISARTELPSRARKVAKRWLRDYREKNVASGVPSMPIDLTNEEAENYFKSEF